MYRTARKKVLSNKENADLCRKRRRAYKKATAVLYQEVPLTYIYTQMYTHVYAYIFILDSVNAYITIVVLLLYICLYFTYIYTCVYDCLCVWLFFLVYMGSTRVLQPHSDKLISRD